MIARNAASSQPRTPGTALLLVLLAWLAGSPQPLLFAAEEPLHSEYVVTLLDIEQGLPQNSANAIVQTADGCLWFGTWAGLTRYNGKEFTVFSELEVPTLPSSGIVNLHLDHGGRLWVSTLRGMASVKEGTWTAYGKESGWVGNYVRAFAESPANELCATTFDGKVLRFHPEGFEELPSPPGALDDGVYPHFDELGSLWIVTPHFVGRFVAGKWVEMISASTWAEEGFQGMATGRDGALWIITDVRIRKYQGSQVVWECPGTKTKYGVWHAREDSQGTLWIGTMDQGLYRLTPDGRWRQFTRENGLPSNVVRDVFEDREGNLWVGTDGGGLLSLRPRLFQVWDRARGLPEDYVASVFADPHGRVYLGMFEEGVVCLEGETLRRICPPGSTQPWTGTASTLLVDRKGRLWVGGNGINRFDGEHHQVFGEDPIGKSMVNSLLEDAHGRIWAACDKCIYCLDGSDMHAYPLPDVPEEGGTAMAEDPRDGSIWVCGNITGALYRWRDGQFAPAPVVRATKGHRVNSLRANRDGTLWMGSERTSILGCLRDGKLMQAAVPTAVPDVFSFGPLLPDEAGNLWLGSVRGIVRVPREELEAFLEGRKTELASQLFTKDDGVPTKDMSTGSPPCWSRDPQGRLWFATVKGAVVVEPKRFQINPAPPVLAIDKVLRDNVVVATRDYFLTSALPTDGPVLVPAGTGRIEIHYSGLCLSAPNNVRYRYMVEDVDKDWIDVGNQCIAYLQGLRPGTHRFQVKAANNHGVWTEAPITLVLEVQPFYWQTLWFQALVVGGLMGSASLAAWGVTRGRLRRQIERLEHQRLLAREQARLASVLEATSDLVAFLDESGNILYLNQAGRRMAGIRAEASVQGLRVSDLHPPWATEVLLHQAIPAAGRDGTWSGETAVRHGDGPEVPVSQVVQVHKGPDGSVNFLSTIARDISERMSAEAQLRGSLREKDALLKEIHHRVKNNLQLISSLLALQANRVKDVTARDLLAESQNRVRTMALVHENLYRAGNFAGISLAAHVESLCTHLFRSFGAASGRIALDAQIDDVALDLDRAIPCGLIINELVCNSLKHAFPGGRSGRVMVKFCLSSEKWYTLVVGDNGVGLPLDLDPCHADSTGLQLVSDLTEQLDGTLTVDRTDGTTVTLRFHAGPRGGP